MNQEMSLSVLFGKVEQGDRQSLDTLTTRVRDKVYVYLYRLTLDHHTVVDHETLAQLEDRSQDTTIIPAQRREMIEAITQSPNALKLTYRNVLTLRCYDELAYAETASTTGGTEMQARLPFFQAKQALRRTLSRRRVKRDSLPTALTLFGSATSLRPASSER